MTGNVAFDIVIGLVFTYLLYSLYATVLMELTCSLFGLRAKNLRYTLKRMLKDEKKYPNRFLKSLANIVNTFSRSIGLSTNLKNDELYKLFWTQPNIKYLSSGGFGGKPSYISSSDFSKGVIDGIKLPDSDFSLMAAFEAGLGKMPDGSDTKNHLKSLMEDANNDPLKFRLLLEKWFDSTMERSAGWFKQTTQIVLLFISTYIVVSFNVDTLSIIRKLSVDKNAREQMVKMAIDFNERNAPLINRTTSVNDSANQLLSQRLDSLEALKKMLSEDMAKSQSILSSKWNIPDGVTGLDVLWYKLSYVFSFQHFLGFMLSILALSLGAPFWFDLLNKLVKLRTSRTATENSGGESNDKKVIYDSKVLNRVG